MQRGSCIPVAFHPQDKKWGRARCATRSLSQVLGVGSGPGGRQANPKSGVPGPAEVSLGLPKRAPAAPAPGTLPAPGVRTHRSLSPAAEPGSGGPCGCCMPSGPSATRRPGAGLRPGAGSSEGLDGPAAAPLLSSGSCYTPGARGKFGGARGGAEGVEGPRPRPAPSCPRSPTVPTRERPPPARHGSAHRGSPTDALLPGTGPQEGGRPGGVMVPTRSPLGPTGLTEPYLGARY